MSRLTDKQREWINYYFECGFNATEAARRAGYKNPNKAGPANRVKEGIRQIIEARLAYHTMSADEVLARLAEHARASMEDFINTESRDVDLNKAREGGNLHLVKKFKRADTQHGERVEIELHDAQSALVHIGRHHGLFTDNIDVKTGGKPLGFTADEMARLEREAEEELRDFDEQFDDGGG